jgi:hypothetical protein
MWWACSNNNFNLQNFVAKDAFKRKHMDLQFAILMAVFLFLANFSQIVTSKIEEKVIIMGNSSKFHW